MSLLIIDLGGQYCHLIKRTLGDIDIAADIRNFASLTLDEARQYQGIILSGGPNSVNDDDSPIIDNQLLDSGIPMLGICYGHQLLAKMLGGTVETIHPEYGNMQLTVLDHGRLLEGLSQQHTVWMSHGDTVMTLPNAVINAMTPDCFVAAFSHQEKTIFGVQFHPEVMHTEYGSRILQNFANICDVERSPIANQIETITNDIQVIVGNRKVFFFISGGVDSTVAFALCAKALRKDQLFGIYVDTGFMRLHEVDYVRDCFDRLKLSDRIAIKNYSPQFMKALADIVDPEEKRAIIGRLFVDVQRAILTEYASDDDWMLGQGTIYPDIIESGPSGAAKIKTHHNRCAEIQRLIASGRVIEPLKNFYKDQVRDIGHDLGIPAFFINRWPFPGPGLAIRCLCAKDAGTVTSVDLEMISPRLPTYQAIQVPLRSVGVQGDARTYRTTMAIMGPLDKRDLTEFARHFHQDRIIAYVAGNIDLEAGQVIPATLTNNRVNILRLADDAVCTAMMGYENLCWQFPVVLIPLSFRGGESIVLRPVSSRDGMTADFVVLPEKLLTRIVTNIMAINGVDAIFLDVSDKPPATIEWE